MIPQQVTPSRRSLHNVRSNRVAFPSRLSIRPATENQRRPVNQFATRPWCCRPFCREFYVINHFTFELPSPESKRPSEREKRGGRRRCLRAASTKQFARASVMISNVIYPKAEFVPASTHSSSGARLPLSRCKRSSQRLRSGSRRPGERCLALFAPR